MDQFDLDVRVASPRELADAEALATSSPITSCKACPPGVR
ncbi:FDLD family class I lanthipeptide [Allokutzneria oryzae]|uniref:FDLD family class I lanthipeptide n=1 Tax=Allokutzneria oryzae TaxID=1378989 RepID=A0ABV5ZSK4_9PSEU